MSNMIFTTKYVEEFKHKINEGYIPKRHENPFISGEPDVRRANLTFRWTKEEQLEYAKCKFNVHYFAQKYCKIKTSDGSIGNFTYKGRKYQRKILDLISNNRFSILMASRQIGKTVSVAISILHYVIFNVDKNVMIMANKLSTTTEILDKIKSIYKHLPFFLKPGVSSWAARSIVFKDTGCRIMTSARTKEPAIGFTIDFLYFDEFAHIPRTIIESFYRSAYPTVSAVENSKIVITSTPNGRNLFWKILDAAERPDGDPRKNNFKALRVYWWQVPGRNVTYVRLNQNKLDEYNLTKELVFNYIKHHFNIDDNNIVLKYNNEDFRWVIHIKNSLELSNNDIRQLILEEDIFDDAFGDKAEKLSISINNVAQVTSWKEETIKDIGSEEAFNQEYGLQFYAASNLTFSEDMLAKISDDEEEFVWHEIPEFERLPHIDYKDFKWINNREDVFNWEDRKKYWYAVGVDIAEGLGQDYSVINLFRILPRTKEELKNARIESVYDFFKMEQVGLFHSNTTSVKRLAEMLYVLSFHILDENRIKIVLEYNTYGAEILAHMPNLYQGNNNFSSHIFARYKHRADALYGKIGLKVKNNKGMLVKEYQNRINNYFIFPHEETTIREITTFVRVENHRSQQAKYESETGHDDCVMAIVGAASLYGNDGFKDLIDFFIEKELDDDYIKFIEHRLDQVEYPTGIDYNILWSAKKKLSMQQEFFEHAIIKNHELSKGGLI